jgi:hypothetical protein
MRYYYTFLCLLFLSFAQGQTMVSGAVYGKWTLSGSPYLVQNNLYISPYDVLEIEPGVEVLFQGMYQVNVSGVLDAVGTAAQPITFRMQDTTGWHNRMQMAGGWQGIHFEKIQAGFVINDSSSLTYCNIQDMKTGFISNFVTAGLRIDRSLLVSHSKISHNIDKQYINGDAVKVSLDSTMTVTFADCEIFDNHVARAAIEVDNFWGGIVYLKNSKIHHNIDCTGILGYFANLVIEDNEFYENSDYSQVGASPIAIVGKKAIIRHNKIHHNIGDQHAFVHCDGGRADIDGNLICNNQQISGNCGYSDGGGAIHVGNDGTLAWDSTSYVIRNNVIVNNFTGFHGSGIHIYDAWVNIMNNHFVHNQSANYGAAIFGFGSKMTLNIKNNVFHNNVNNLNAPVGSILATHDIYLSGGNTLLFDYNWTEKPVYQFIRFDVGIPFNGFVGDTTHNIIGTNPQLIAPTSTYGAANSAMSANFSLLSNSACINAGDSDTTNCYVSALDYALNPRLITRIDMGAFEYKDAHSDTEQGTLRNILHAYPNPAQNKIHISLPYNKGNIRLVDEMGREILAKTVNEKDFSLELSLLANGIYFLIWENENGNAVQKISVQH